MSARMRRTAARAGAGFAALAVVGVFLPTGPASAAADSEVEVINTETVQVYTDADGKILTQRVYEQLTLTGVGSATLANPVEESGLRNLDGFGGYDVSDGIQRLDVDVDGVQRVRTVSDYSGDLPLDVSIAYVLDGEPVEASDIVGEDGVLEVTYTVKNVTARSQEITFPDGKGGDVTEMAEVAMPMVGSLSTLLPAGFTDVTSGQANMAGDGKGGTKMSFTMTLVPPIGSDTATFGYTATIKDGIVPRATLSALPVNPLESPTFKNAATSYQGGADTGAALAEGATEIDGHLLEIRDGASKLLGGLIQLRDGSQELQAGLAGEAAPGAQRLANGAGELDAGLVQLDDGAGRLADGAGRLDSGAGELADGAGQVDDGAGRLADGAGRLDAGAGQFAAGAGQLADGTGAALTGSQKLHLGLQQISAGLAQLADAQKGLPAAKDGVAQLQAGVDEILAGFGAVDATGTLLHGLHSLELGAGQLEGGLQRLLGDGSQANPGLVAAKGGVDQVQEGIGAAVAPGGGLDQLLGGLEGLKGFCDADELACLPTIEFMKDGVDESKDNLTVANEGLLDISGGLGTAITGLANQLIPGAGQLKAGAGAAKDGALQLKGGAAQVSGGLDQLATGLAAAVTGVLQLSAGADAATAGAGDLSDGLALLDGGAGQLSDGADTLAAGAGELSDGAGTLASGTGRLAAGAGRLADGAGELSDGAGRLADGTGEARAGSGLVASGASELASGLQDAADGSGRLADGLAEAAEGAPALPDGADRLSSEGMAKLIAAGEGTAQEYGKLYAIVDAGSQRAQAESMALGAPENATGLTAYSFEIKGADGEAGRNTVRALGAALIGGLGLGALGLRRRFV